LVEHQCLSPPLPLCQLLINQNVVSEEKAKNSDTCLDLYKFNCNSYRKEYSDYLISSNNKLEILFNDDSLFKINCWSFKGTASNFWNLFR
jgi:hypothetical protein